LTNRFLITSFSILLAVFPYFHKELGIPLMPRLADGKTLSKLKGDKDGF